MNTVIVDSLYDFAVNLTYDSHESNVDTSKYIDNYFEGQGIDIHFKKMFEDYTRFYLKENKGWFPDREEITEWYLNYKKVKV